MNIDSNTVSGCGFPEQWLFWSGLILAVISILLAFVLSQHTKKEYDGISFLAVFLALFSDKYFEGIGVIGIFYRVSVTVSIVCCLVLYLGYKYLFFTCIN